jgi:hypothetical protein
MGMRPSHIAAQFGHASVTVTEHLIAARCNIDLQTKRAWGRHEATHRSSSRVDVAAVATEVQQLEHPQLLKSRPSDGEWIQCAPRRCPSRTCGCCSLQLLRLSKIVRSRHARRAVHLSLQLLQLLQLLHLCCLAVREGAGVLMRFCAGQPTARRCRSRPLPPPDFVVAAVAPRFCRSIYRSTSALLRGSLSASFASLTSLNRSSATF